MAFYKDKEAGIKVVYAATPTRIHIISIYLDERWKYTGKKVARKKLVSDTLRLLQKKHGLPETNNFVGDPDETHYTRLNPRAPIGSRLLDMRKGK